MCLSTGRNVDSRTLNHLEKVHNADIRAGRYWYDRISGLWGFEGGPSVGQTLPGGNYGPLSRQASNGSTGVFMNGRELHKLEYVYLLRTYGDANVQKGRYWLNAQGIGGFEGGPAFFNLGAVRKDDKRSYLGGYSKRGAVIGADSTVEYLGQKGETINCTIGNGCIYPNK